MKVYIAGSISNDPDYKEKFQRAEDVLTARGYQAINPAKNQGFSYKEYIDAGLYQLAKCDAIYLLTGYEDSRGALLEKHYADTISLRVMYEQEVEE